MKSPHLLLSNPELYEVFRLDMREVMLQHKRIQGSDTQEYPIEQTVLRSEADIVKWVAQMKEEAWKLFSVDCEWHGNTYLSGDLRTIQFCWTPGKAVAIRFMNDQVEYDLDITYEAVGKILQPLLDPDDIKYVGHHWPADAVWMSHWLGLKVLDKCYMDTEFAQQTVDEHSELGLERGIAMRYSTLGRYDRELVLWKRANKSLCEDGYGYIPDDILLPYSCYDVDCVLRAIPYLERQLKLQGLSDYYHNILHPFSADVFVTFALEGLPMDTVLMDDLRELFNYAKERLEIRFRKAISADAVVKLVGYIIEHSSIINSLPAYQAAELIKVGKSEEALQKLKKLIPRDKVLGLLPFVDHMICSPDFNLRSKPQMVRWLFDVCGLTPIKSTNQKAKGLPSMDWQKVLELPDDRQKLYLPATDKQTLEILSSKEPLIDKIMDLNVVGNLCKAFLKNPKIEYDESGDMIVNEEGLHKWLVKKGAHSPQLRARARTRKLKAYPVWTGLIMNSITSKPRTNSNIGRKTAAIK